MTEIIFKEVEDSESPHRESVELYRDSWCSCASNTGPKDSLVLCLCCGSGFRYQAGRWMKVLSFDNASLKQILEVIDGPK
jgi:hypothetical protein